MVCLGVGVLECCWCVPMLAPTHGDFWLCRVDVQPHLQCDPQDVDGIFDLMGDILLHQLLTHPDAQATDGYTPAGNTHTHTHAVVPLI